MGRTQVSQFRGCLHHKYLEGRKFRSRPPVLSANAALVFSFVIKEMQLGLPVR
jgi:hypothetical protein